jgi:hypothetical protein
MHPSRQLEAIVLLSGENARSKTGLLCENRKVPSRETAPRGNGSPYQSLPPNAAPADWLGGAAAGGLSPAAGDVEKQRPKTSRRSLDRGITSFHVSIRRNINHYFRNKQRFTRHEFYSIHHQPSTIPDFPQESRHARKEHLHGNGHQDHAG